MKVLKVFSSDGRFIAELPCDKFTTNPTTGQTTLLAKGQHEDIVLSVIPASCVVVVEEVRQQQPLPTPEDLVKKVSEKEKDIIKKDSK